MEEKYGELIKENNRRKKAIFGKYNPITGYGCYDFEHRVHVRIPDYVIPEMWVPEECIKAELLYKVIKRGSIKDFITYDLGKAYSSELAIHICFEISRIRYKEDPEHAMYMNDHIMDKKSGAMIPFRLNYPQRLTLKKLEDMRHEGKPIYLIILKARQWGGSTLSQLYIKWMQSYRHEGWNSIILAQVKSISKKIKSMYRVSIKQQQGWTIGAEGCKLQFSPFENDSNTFVISDGKRILRNNTISIASFENYDNVRGDNFHCAHFSEVAYWKLTEEHDPEKVLSSVKGGIDNIPDNIQIYESSGRGASGFFYDMCQSAMRKDGSSSYEFIFIPCWVIEKDMEKVDDPMEFAKWLYDNKDDSKVLKGYRENGKWFWHMWQIGASFEAINWYRHERNGYLSHSAMATEAPIDHVEAFQNSGNLVFDRYSIEDLKETFCKKPKYYANIHLIGKGEQMLKHSKIDILDKGVGDLKIWQLPNNKILKLSNRYIVSVDIGGSSNTSDYTVMTVIDRKGLAEGVNGKPSVVARWRGHVRHDRLAWMAAVLALFYDNALLVIESNTADKEKNSNTEGDHFGSIIDEIGDYYDNLYIRDSTPDKVTGKTTNVYGFVTNKLTKGWLIDNLKSYVEDKLWEEPDDEMYHELSIYERKGDNSLGNIAGSGNHDDVLMATAIGLYISQGMERPKWNINATKKIVHNDKMTEAYI